MWIGAEVGLCSYLAQVLEVVRENRSTRGVPIGADQDPLLWGIR